MKNPTLLLSVLAVAVCALRLLLDGVSFKLFGSIVSIPHTDPLAYGSFLTPVLGAHGYMNRNTMGGKLPQKVDDPDNQ